MVEHEEVRVGYYFALDNRVVKISPDDLRYMPALALDLEPLRITIPRLYSLRFDPVFGTNSTQWQKAFNGTTVILKAFGGNRWAVEVDKAGKTRYVRNIHELQDLWRGLFDEPLQRRAGDQQVEEPVLKLRPEYQVIPPVDRQRSGGSRRPVMVAPRPREFYLTWDCLFVLCTMPLIIWKVVDDDAYFFHAGKKWGFQCVYGKVDKRQTDRMAEWVRGEIINKRFGATP